MKINISPIPALKDNYIWAIENENLYSAIIIDPGEAQPVFQFLKQKKLSLQAILITHHHWDHTNGIGELATQFNVPIFGFAKDNTTPLTVRLKEHDKIEIPGFPSFTMLEIPGHTLSHVAYYAKDILFCGDTLFSAGCGRLFEGKPEQMFTSLQKMASLPEETKVYCAHEYTLNNLRFASLVEPNNPKIKTYLQYVLNLKNACTLPSSIEQEKQVNPFLLCDVDDVIASVEKHAGKPLHDIVEVFAALRQWKNNF